MKKTQIRKPEIDTAKVLQFATGSTQVAGASKTVKAKKAVQDATKSRSGLVPANDVRLTANIREELHLKLKIAAANRRTTIGELIEDLVAKHL